MTMNTISLTIPMETSALTRAAEMLQNMASDLKPLIEITNSDGKLPANVLKDLNEAINTPVPKLAAVPAAVVQPKADLPAVPATTVTAPPPTPANSATVTDMQQPGTVNQNTTTPTAAVTPAPTATDAAPSRTAAATELDGNGYPWDVRIHSSAKTRVVKGDTWKLIRGIEAKSPGLVEQVRAEHTTPAAEEATPASLAFEIGPTGQAQPAEVTPPPPAAEVTPPPAAEVDAITFVDILQTIGARQIDKPEYGESINLALTENGLTSLPDLVGADPELLAKIAARLDELWLG